VDILSLLSGGDLAGADGPDGLVGNDNLAPVVAGDVGLQGLELGADDLDGLARLALLEGLTAAPDDLEALLNGPLGLGGDDIVRLAENGAALGVAENGPVDVAVKELGDGDLARVGTAGLVEDVLGSNLDVGADGLTDEGEVKGGRSDNDLWNWVLVVWWWHEGFAMQQRFGKMAGHRGGSQGEGHENVPVASSRVAWLRLATISLMPDTVPFLERAENQ
jgi:hypothetical protein